MLPDVPARGPASRPRRGREGIPATPRVPRFQPEQDHSSHWIAGLPPRRNTSAAPFIKQSALRWVPPDRRSDTLDAEELIDDVEPIQGLTSRLARVPGDAISRKKRLLVVPDTNGAWEKDSADPRP